MNPLELLIFQFSTPMLLVLAIAELVSGWISGANFYTWRGTITNIWTALLRFPLDLLVRTTGLAFFAWLSTFHFVEIHHRWLYWGLLVLGGDLCFWLMHWVSHQSRLFWATHAVHHSAQEMNLSVSLRADFWQTGTKFFYYSPLLLFGFQGQDVLVAYLITLTYGNFLHTEAFRAGQLRWIEWLLVTPSMHRVHHASNVRYLDKNMGMVFSLWDHLFGTYTAEKATEKVVYGLVEQIEYGLPLEVLTHEFSAIGHDLRRNGLSFFQKMKYLFAAPGWSHDGSKQTARQMQADFFQKKATKSVVFALLLSLSFGCAYGQADHLLLVTSDGIRWQEVFSGADSSLLFDPRFVADTAAFRAKYWSPNPAERRRMLLPFLWTVVQQQGQIYGNRRIGSRVAVANLYRISYPGYAEILTGRADPLVFDNHPWRDRHANVLAYLDKYRAFSGKVAAFASWSNLFLILGGSKSTFPINAGSAKMPIRNWEKDPPPEDRQFWSPAILHTINRHDSITWRLADEFWQREKPAVLYLSVMETDLIAHQGRYDAHLDALHRLDSLVGNLWQKMQSDSVYQGRTALFLTTDHGRGRGGFMGRWTVHNHLTAGSQQIWFAAMSPNLVPLGEISGNQQGKKIKAKQFAPILTALVGLDFDRKRPGKISAVPGLKPRANPNDNRTTKVTGARSPLKK